MNVLLLGSGSREHAFAWKIKQSSKCTTLYILPGNGGTAQLGVNLEGSPTDFDTLRKYSLELTIDLILVGPEEPLILGIRDYFLDDLQLKHISVIGPSGLSARLEGSKDFSKKFMVRHDIPTASSQTFVKGEEREGLHYLEAHPLPIVLKADGLAAGKGVIICADLEEAKKVFLDILQNGKFGRAGDKVVIEEFLEGIEMSLFVLTDGRSYKILPEAKDYKRIGEGDTGSNTGGMGSVSPVPFFTAELKEAINQKIIIPTLEGLREEGFEYFGFLFIGLMICPAGPFVIEYNVRMGDPETQSVLPRMEGDFLDLLIAVADSKLDQYTLKINPKFSSTVVSVSKGYPGDFVKGLPIYLPHLDSNKENWYFHGGTLLKDEDLGLSAALITNGGRVISSTALGENLEESVKNALILATRIDFAGKTFRSDIGKDLMP